MDERNVKQENIAILVARYFTKQKEDMRIITVREEPDYAAMAIKYLQQSWPEVVPVIYENCIMHSITAEQFLPQWYLLEQKSEIIGCAGLITNDFISRMDLYPWLCALHIEEACRGRNLAKLLMEKAIADTKKGGYTYLNLCTDLTGYYEKFGFKYIGEGYHPWEASSAIYQIAVT